MSIEAVELQENQDKFEDASTGFQDIHAEHPEGLDLEKTSNLDNAEYFVEESFIQGATDNSSTPKARSGSVRNGRSVELISEQDLLEQQALKEGEKQPEVINDSTDEIRDAFSVSRIDLSARVQLSESVTGLPSGGGHNQRKAHAETQATLAKVNRSESNGRDSVTSSQASTSSLLRRPNGMGGSESKGPDRTQPRNIMSEEPDDLLQNRKKVSQSEVTGNCRPWSDHVYYKLFMDTEGRNATLMVLKCEITYVDVFTDEEHSLYKSRFIGGKSEGVAQLFVFDLMKANWEEKIPKSQAIELNVDIVMSSSPIHFCSETLLNLIQLEKTYLKHRNFDGQLNVVIRFAHSYGWDLKDESIRQRVHQGLRNLFREGVNLEVMSADVIMEEMRVDGILATDDELVKHYISKRHAWSSPPLKTTASQSQHEETSGPSSTLRAVDYDSGDAHRDVTLTSLSKRNAPSGGGGESLATMTDEYYVALHSGLWNIIQDTKRIQNVLDETLEDL